MLSSNMKTFNITFTCNTTNTECFTEEESGDLKTVYSIIGFFFACLMLFGVTLTGIMVWTFWRTKQLHNSTNVFIIGLILADFLMLLFGLPIVIYDSFSGGHDSGYYLCQFQGFTMTALGLAMICILTTVSIDRYIIITRRQLAVQVTIRKAIWTLVGCFLYGAVWALLPFLGFGRFDVEPSGVSCAPDYRSKDLNHVSYNVAMFVFLFFIPLVIMMYAYTSILLKLRQDSSWRRRVEQREVSEREVHTTLTVVLILVTFLACWLPYSVISFWSIFNDASKLSTVAAIFAPLMAKSSAALNPIAYVAVNRDIRKAIKQQVANVLRHRNRVGLEM